MIIHKSALPWNNDKAGAMKTISFIIPWSVAAGEFQHRTN